MPPRQMQAGDANAKPKKMTRAKVRRRRRR